MNHHKASGALAGKGCRLALAVAISLVCATGHGGQALAEEYGYGLDGLGFDSALSTDPMADPLAEVTNGESGEEGIVAVDARGQLDYAGSAEAGTDPSLQSVLDLEPEAKAAIEAAHLEALAGAAAPTLREAQGAAIIDGGGNVLYQKNGEQPMSPASVTKVMTAVVAIDSLQQGKSLDDVVKLVAPDLGPDAQMADFAEGETATFRDLLRVMLVYSANDAAYNVALHVAGSISAFADLMNAKAAEIGMTNSHFMNPHGIDEDGHQACAIDLARLSRYAMQNYPFIAQTVSLNSVEIPIHGEPTIFRSTDALLDSYEGIRGVKTGYAEAFTFMGASSRGNVSLYAAVLGCTTVAGRFNDTASMMDWAYAQFGEKSISDDAWAVRVNPYALDLSYQTVVATSGDAQGTIWPGGGAASYTSTIARPGRLLDNGEGYGWSTWSQSGRAMGSSTYMTREVPVRVSAWPTFALPLFENATTLGRMVTDA